MKRFNAFIVSALVANFTLIAFSSPVHASYTTEEYPPQEPLALALTVGGMGNTPTEASETVIDDLDIISPYVSHLVARRTDLRTGPGTHFSKVVTLNQGQWVKVHTVSNGWAYVTVGVNGPVGWVQRTHLV